MPLLNMLTEQVGKDVLYHFTLSTNIIKILKDNKLKGDKRIVSLTRKFNFSNEWEHFGDVRIALDRKKLSNNYKIKPFNWVAYRSSDSYYGYEDEEMVKGIVRDLDRYIVQIDIHEKFHRGYVSQAKFKSIINLLQHSGEPYPVNVVNKWKPVK